MNEPVVAGQDGDCFIWRPLTSEDCGRHGARIAVAPSADINGVQEVSNVRVERHRIFEINGMAGIWHDDQRGGWNCAFH